MKSGIDFEVDVRLSTSMGSELTYISLSNRVDSAVANLARKIRSITTGADREEGARLEMVKQCLVGVGSCS